MSAVITVSSLSKAYGANTALRDVTFSVPAGMIYGLIGPNGAGKTTTLAILAGLVSPSGGEATVALPQTRVGFYSPQFGLFDYLSGREILAACARLQGVPRTAVERRTHDLLTLFDLEAAADLYVYEYSLGMRQKLGLAAAFIHAPEVLLLDEPFDGLDAASVYRFVATLRAISRKGKTILLTSHDLALVERICDRVAILHDGVIIRELDLRELEAADAPAGRLESVMWETVGVPTFEELNWI